MTAPDPAVTCLSLGRDGSLHDRDAGKPVPAIAVPDFLDHRLAVRDETTDIFVFVHGWQTKVRRAIRATSQLAAVLAETYAAQGARYQDLPRFVPQFVAICWPSRSSPLPAGYRRIRDRSYEMTDHGHAATVLAQLLGYLNDQRRMPGDGATLVTRGGQYLHGIGHSFGGRMLGRAITRASDPPAATLGWPWSRPEYPYTVDTLAVFQMAAQPAIFCEELGPLLSDAPINGPIALTFSKHDRALGFWHRMPEKGRRGIGYSGATCPAEAIETIPLRQVAQEYSRPEFLHRILNIDASWRYRAGRFLLPQGAHSDYLYPETAHLLLSLAAGAR